MEVKFCLHDAAEIAILSEAMGKIAALRKQNELAFAAQMERDKNEYAKNYSGAAIGPAIGVGTAYKNAPVGAFATPVGPLTPLGESMTNPALPPSDAPNDLKSS